jgi:hypothetical protein
MSSFFFPFFSLDCGVMDYIFVMTCREQNLKVLFFFVDFVDNNVMTPFEDDDISVYSP